MIIETSQLIDQKFIGIPYEFGRSDFKACDCMGIIVLYLRENGFDLSYDNRDLAAIKHWWASSPRRFFDFLFQFGTMVMFSEVQKFDVMLFLDEGGTFPSFPGVMIDERHFLTLYDKGRSHVLMLDERWKNKFWGAIHPRKI